MTPPSDLRWVKHRLDRIDARLRHLLVLWYVLIGLVVISIPGAVGVVFGLGLPIIAVAVSLLLLGYAVLLAFGLVLARGQRDRDRETERKILERFQAERDRPGDSAAAPPPNSDPDCGGSPSGGQTP